MLLMRKIAVPLTVLCTAVLAVLRILLPPPVLPNGNTDIPYYMIIGTVAALAVLFVLCAPLRGKARFTRSGLLPVGIAGSLYGLLLFGETLAQALNYFFEQISPPPANYTGGVMDTVLTYALMVLGLTGGLALLWVGLTWAGGRRQQSFSLLALPAVLYQWVRLARYELSYASAVDVGRTFFDFMVFVFALMFLFSLARLIAGTGKPKRVMFFAAGSALFSLSAAAVIIYNSITALPGALEQGRENLISLPETLGKNLVGLADIALGLLALTAVICIAFCMREEPEEIEETETETEPEQEPETDDFAVDQPEEIPAEDTPIEEPPVDNIPAEEPLANAEPENELDRILREREPHRGETGGDEKEAAEFLETVFKRPDDE
ncbi:MAG: hypothetical protein FWE80_08280 [Oscillospiraceae bacterium]|nr:hypothetical protein [Oscillospiraceae bacterium]